MYNKNFNPFNDVMMEPAQKHSTLKDMCAADRPREKLLAKGAEALTISELLAIIIGGGTTEKTAVELMQQILNDCNNKLKNLSNMQVEDLIKYKGIGEAKALSIIAAAEIGRRRLQENVDDMVQFKTGKEVQMFMKPRILDLDHEESWVLLLNNSARLLRCVHISKGGMTETAIDTRVIMRQAIVAKATCFILVHNHPSGNIKPSIADLEITKRIKNAGDMMNIRLLDHVIVTENDYYSFTENEKI